MLNSIVQIHPLWPRRIRFAVLLLAIAVIPYHVSAEDKLSTGEFIALGSFSMGTLLLGSHVSRIDSGKSSLIVNALPLENAIQSWLGGEYYVGKSNFLDSHFGSTVTPVGAGLVLALVNVSYPRDDALEDVGQDMFLFTTGLMTTVGVTRLVKGLVARPRPYVRMDPNFESTRYMGAYKQKNLSFFSGHASSAFFTMAYLNLRMRATMRQEMSPSDYRDWRWAPPLVLYGWASMVGWTRIHAYRHYISDVVVGAAVGWLIAEAFYSLNEEIDSNKPKNSRAVAPIFRISIPI